MVWDTGAGPCPFHSEPRHSALPRSKPDTAMESPRFSSDKLVDYIERCIERQSVVTVNLGIYQDGAIGTEAAQWMSAARRKIRGS